MGKNGQLITFENEIFNAVTFKLFLEKLILKANRGTKKILLVLDNARYNHARILQDWLKEVSIVLELFFLPPYSPELNPVEMLWKKTRRGVTHNRYFKSLEELRYDLNMFWGQFGNSNGELKNYPHLFNAFIIFLHKVRLNFPNRPCVFWQCRNSYRL
jgi:transposase